MTTDLRPGEVPIGYMINAHGHLIPKDKVEDIDIERNDLVHSIMQEAKSLQDEMRSFKEASLGNIGAFIDLAAEKYNTKLGGRKGNISLVSFDGRYKILLAVSDSLNFDERLQIAKQLIDECIHTWTVDSNGNIKVLIEHAFQTDKQGNINTARVLGLMRLKIDDEKWRQAMEALKDSIQVVCSKSYMRLYERVGSEDRYEQISMDIAGL